MNRQENFFAGSQSEAPKEFIQDSFLRQDMLGAVKNQGKLSELQRLYGEKYPDQLEGISALFDLAPFLDLDKRLDAHEEKGEERREMIDEVTRYQYLLTHLIARTSDKEFLGSFWRMAEEIARVKENTRSLNMMRKGILSQVAVLKIMEKIGASPTLSHPRDDARHAIDLWIDSKKAVQVKGIREDKQQLPEIMETESVSFPGVEIESDDGVKHFNSEMFQKFQHFQARLDVYRELAGKRIKGYMMVIPYSAFDPVTGEPSEDIVEFVREKIHLSAKHMKKKKGWLSPKQKKRPIRPHD